MHSLSQSTSSLQLILCIILIILGVYNAPVSSPPLPSSSTHTHMDHYLLSCGLPTASTKTSFDNRTWQTDNNAKFASPSALAANTSVAMAADPTTYAADQVPCANARIFNSSFTYSFPVSPGPKFIRLHYCPATYANTPASAFFLTLEANGGAGPFTLLHNFSAYLRQRNSSSSDPTNEEFLLSVNTSRLNLTFSPTSPASLAFINGIEIVPVPDGLYTGEIDDTPCGPVKNVNNPTSQSSIPESVALQTVVRLNVGGAEVAPHNDSGGMLRVWGNDKSYLAGDFAGATPNCTTLKTNYKAPSVPEYAAPGIVYCTARVMGPYNASFKMANNLTWEIPVDPGFDYLVRLHFCEIDPSINRSNQRVFNIYINNQTAQRQVDVMTWANAWGSPVCQDYRVTAYGEAAPGRSLTPLWLALHPDVEGNPQYHDAILNGMEVFKLNQPNRSLASPNPACVVDSPSPNPQNTNSGRSRFSSKGLLPLLGSVLGSVALCLVVAFGVYWWWFRGAACTNTANLTKGSNGGLGSKAISSKYGSHSLPSHLCRQFTLRQIKDATRDFDEKMVIGVGGFGKVYKGSISADGEPTNTMVAIKRLNPYSNQGAHEFRTEIEMLSKLRHVHLVSLIGYCNEGAEKILVYEYMSHGTLRDHLYSRSMNQNHSPPPLPWKERLKICIGAARGLYYLHSGAKHPIIHRDVKSTNILLDEKWTAKVSDFGLSKVGPTGEPGEPNHVSTVVKGSVGYLDPEYRRLNQLTDKSDVYSFGVVLFEVLCGRPAKNSTLPKEQVNLALWARSHCQSGTLSAIVDPNLTGQIAPECLRKFGEVAEMCVRDNASERPCMGDVVWGLDFALELQLTAEKNVADINGALDSDQGPVAEEISSPTNVDNGGGAGSACNAEICEESLRKIGSGNITTTSDNDADDRLRSGSVFSEIMNPQGR